MSLWGKLRQGGEYLRKLRPSRGPDSYFQYEQGRKSARKQADRAREHAEDSAEREREKAARGREYEERYTRELEGDIARERAERAEEMEPDR
jgi:hypothetical protein